MGIVEKYKIPKNPEVISNSNPDPKPIPKFLPNPDSDPTQTEVKMSIPLGLITHVFCTKMP
jgi:hypothetical protein